LIGCHIVVLIQRVIVTRGWLSEVLG